jgi:NADP-dependent 3-hydroxy acid dehydrogenase YdfG
MRSAVVITGASRGFGRCLALDFALELATSDLDLVHTSRFAPVCASSDCTSTSSSGLDVKTASMRPLDWCKTLDDLCNRPESFRCFVKRLI